MYHLRSLVYSDDLINLTITVLQYYVSPYDH